MSSMPSPSNGKLWCPVVLDVVLWGVMITVIGTYGFPYPSDGPILGESEDDQDGMGTATLHSKNPCRLMRRLFVWDGITTE
ncbi:hypothetical protein KC366_g77 [Hortaea werneckii]|nr:hypothetical protein KC366_g77 [Hortaea werneckii]